MAVEFGQRVRVKAKALGLHLRFQSPNGACPHCLPTYMAFQMGRVPRWMSRCGFWWWMMTRRR